MRITFQQIDNNNNGYLEQNEINNARKMGVKRELYVGMTAEDVKNNVSKKQKLGNIINIFMNAKKYMQPDNITNIPNDGTKTNYDSLVTKENIDSLNKERLEDELLLEFAKLQSIEKETTKQIKAHKKRIDELNNNLVCKIFNRLFNEDAITIQHLKIGEQESKYNNQLERTSNSINSLLNTIFKDWGNKRLELWRKSK